MVGGLERRGQRLAGWGVGIHTVRVCGARWWS